MRCALIDSSHVFYRFRCYFRLDIGRIFDYFFVDFGPKGSVKIDVKVRIDFDSDFGAFGFDFGWLWEPFGGPGGAKGTSKRVPEASKMGS